MRKINYKEAEELLTYADPHIKQDKVVDFEERFRGILERSKNNYKRYKALKKRI